MRTIYSFGYKMNGEDQFATTGPNAPLIIDCRGLYNPHQDANLRKMTGRDEEVQQRMQESALAQIMVQEAIRYLTKNPDGTVAFGCSYGKHRSVAMAEIVAREFSNVIVIHTGAAADPKYTNGVLAQGSKRHGK